MFEVRLTRQPTRYIEKAPEAVRRGLESCFEKLEEDPFRIVDPLHGPLKGNWKARVGGLRVILEIDLERRVIKVIFIGPRGDVY